MGSSIPYNYRKLIVAKRKSGKSYTEISQELGYSISGIKKIWYAYQKLGEASYSTNYKNCGRKSPFDKSVKDSITKIRTGQQGAPFVFSKLHKDYPHKRIPSIRTLQSWWQTKKVSCPKGRPSNEKKKMDTRGTPYLASRRKRTDPLEYQTTSMLDEYS